MLRERNHFDRLHKALQPHLGLSPIVHNGPCERASCTFVPSLRRVRAAKLEAFLHEALEHSLGPVLFNTGNAALGYPVLEGSLDELATLLRKPGTIAEDPVAFDLHALALVPTASRQHSHGYRDIVFSFFFFDEFFL